MPNSITFIVILEGKQLMDLYSSLSECLCSVISVVEADSVNNGIISRCRGQLVIRNATILLAVMQLKLL